MRIDNLYDEQDAPSGGSFDPLPAGEYRVRITDTEKKATKKGTGWYLSVHMEVTTGEFKGRKIWDRLNLVNENATAVEIARKIFAALRACFGCPRPKDSAELHGLEGTIKLKVVDGGEKYGLKNEVAAYLPRNVSPKDDRPRGPEKGNVPW